jgi:hypothetical protein
MLQCFNLNNISFLLLFN